MPIRASVRVCGPTRRVWADFAHARGEGEVCVTSDQLVQLNQRVGESAHSRRRLQLAPVHHPATVRKLAKNIGVSAADTTLAGRSAVNNAAAD